MDSLLGSGPGRDLWGGLGVDAFSLPAAVDEAADGAAAAAAKEDEDRGSHPGRTPIGRNKKGWQVSGVKQRAKQAVSVKKGMQTRMIKEKMCEKCCGIYNNLIKNVTEQREGIQEKAKEILQKQTAMRAKNDRCLELLQRVKMKSIEDGLFSSVEPPFVTDLEKIAKVADPEFDDMEIYNCTLGHSFDSGIRKGINTLRDNCCEDAKTLRRETEAYMGQRYNVNELVLKIHHIWELWLYNN